MTAVVCVVFIAVGSLLGCRDRRAPQPAQVATLPGAQPWPAGLAERVRAAVAERGAEYRPRTRHLEADGNPRYTNRLILEGSPYLQQHAHNPIDWYPWGDEAFEAARRLGRPVFVSIGYATCHWCHVMEEESFEDEEIARYLNAHYIAIKVDRQQRPDIDAVYMRAVQAMGVRGGWPLNVWLTPDRTPFYGSSYLPPRAGGRGVKIGLTEALVEAKRAFDDGGLAASSAADKPAAAPLRASIEAALAAVAALGTTSADDDDDGDDADDAETHDEPPGREVLDGVALFCRERYDAVYGGFQVTAANPAKFPTAFPMRFLLRHYRRRGDDAFLQMVVDTLAKMAAGGAYDQIGGGFHRYAIDPAWRIPHFEKMLVDNALLALAYIEGYQASGRAELADTAREILAYLARDMRSPAGGFYAATDADSVGPSGRAEEGAYFTWTPAEIRAVVGAADAPLVIAHYGVTDAGDVDGRSVLRVARPLAEVAAARETPLADAAQRLRRARRAMYEARTRRAAPMRDEHVLTAWNGWAIAAFGRAARVLGDDAERGVSYAAIATRAAEFALSELRDGDRLRRSFVGGRATADGYLDDYVAMIAALIELFEATGAPRWLAQAQSLDRALAARFEDPRGGFFFTAREHETVLVRQKPAADGALPSGNAVAALNLLRLYALTTDTAYLDRARRTLLALSDAVYANPMAMPEMLIAVDFYLAAVREIVIIAPEQRAQAAPFTDVLARAFVPNHVLVVAVQDQVAALAEQVPLVRGKVARGGRATAYVCFDQRCDRPTSDPAEFAAQLRRRVDPD